MNDKLNIIERITIEETYNKVLEVLGITKYLEINSDVYNVNVSKDTSVQKRFNYFYKLRQKPADWHGHYYRVFESIKKRIINKNDNISIELVLGEIYSKTKTIEFSFSSKMLHTLLPSKYPIYDSRVKKALDLEDLDGDGYLDKISSASRIYDELIKKYKELGCIADIFDKVLPNTCLTRIKKIDTMLYWYGT